MTQYSPPVAGYDIVKYLALAEDQGKANGETQTQIETRKQMVREANSGLTKGSTQISQVTLSRSGSLYNADTVQQAPLTPGEKNGNQVAHFVDYYDGINKVTLEGMGEKKPIFASLVRDSSLELPHVIRDFPAMILLSMAPPSQFFSRQISIQSINNSLVIEQPYSQPIQDRIHRGIWRLTVNASTLQPQSLEVLNDNTGKTVRQSYTVEAYKKIGNQQVPSRIVTEIPGSFKTTFELQDGRLGSSVDTINFDLPAGTVIDDYRFGPQKAVRYKIADGRIYTDAQVEKLLGEKTQKETKEAAQKTVSHTPFLML